MKKKSNGEILKTDDLKSIGAKIKRTYFLSVKNDAFCNYRFGYCTIGES